MNSLRHAGTIALMFAALGANAQVHRCGDSNVYTDKPCEDMEPVDLRSNTVPAIQAPPPAPPPAQPAAARILPNMSRVNVSPDIDSRDSPATSGTTGTR